MITDAITIFLKAIAFISGISISGIFWFVVFNWVNKWVERQEKGEK